jgi:hypothetical protein
MQAPPAPAQKRSRFPRVPWKRLKQPEEAAAAEEAKILAKCVDTTFQKIKIDLKKRDDFIYMLTDYLLIFLYCSRQYSIPFFRLHSLHQLIFLSSSFFVITSSLFQLSEPSSSLSPLVFGMCVSILDFPQLFGDHEAQGRVEGAEKARKSSGRQGSGRHVQAAAPGILYWGMGAPADLYGCVCYDGVYAYDSMHLFLKG